MTDPILDSATESIYALRTTARGPSGALPLDATQLRHMSSGDLFGLTQNAGMGWNPALLRGKQFLILSTQGGIRAPDGSPIALGYHTGHWEVGLLMEEAARTFSDTVAERMRALHALPDGRSDTVAETTTLPEFPQGEIDTSEVIDLVTERLEAAIGTCRDVHDAVDEEDPTSADILHAILESLEQFAWMVSAENRTPAARAASR